jgi:hypothetical protein
MEYAYIFFIGVRYLFRSSIQMIQRCVTIKKTTDLADHRIKLDLVSIVSIKQ